MKDSVSSLLPHYLNNMEDINSSITEGLFLANKSIKMNDLARYFSIESGIPTLYFSLSASAVTTVREMLSRYTGLDSNKTELSCQKTELFACAIEAMEKAPLYIDDSTGNLPLDAFQSKVDDCIRAYGIKVIIIDDLDTYLLGSNVCKEEILAQLVATSQTKKVKIIASLYDCKTSSKDGTE